MYDHCQRKNRRSVPPPVPPARRWMRRSAPPPTRRCAAGCWNWTPTALPIPFCSTQPLGAKPTLPPWAAEAVRQGKTVAYPVCGEGFALTAAVPSADGWAVGQYGIRTPVPERSTLLQPEQLDLVLVPCTAFDADCYRVGMGKGYYDRYLPRCTRAVKIGIALEVQRVPRAAVDAHDQRLDAFVTERGIYTWK